MDEKVSATWSCSWTAGMTCVKEAPITRTTQTHFLTLRQYSNHPTMQDRRSRPIDDTRASFLDLPPELRNEIYRQTLTSNRALRVSEWTLKSTTIHQQVSVALLVTCRQIHTEATAILYGANTSDLQANKDHSRSRTFLLQPPSGRMTGFIGASLLGNATGLR